MLWSRSTLALFLVLIIHNICSGDFSVNFDSGDVEDDNNAFYLYEEACFKLAEVSSQFELQALDSHHRSQPLDNNFLYSTMLWGKCIVHIQSHYY